MLRRIKLLALALSVAFLLIGVVNAVNAEDIETTSPWSPSIQPVWVQRISPGGQDYGITDIAVDQLGAVVVAAGSSNTSDQRPLIAKISAAGRIIWQRRVHGTEWPSRVAVAVSADRRIFTASSDCKDVRITALDPDGTLLWQRSDGVTSPRLSAEDCDRVGALAADAAGNVFVSGLSGIYNDPNIITETDLAWVVKFDRRGKRLWDRRFALVRCEYDYTGSIDEAEVEQDGTVVLAGTQLTNDPGCSTRSWVRTYRSDGALGWRRLLPDGKNYSRAMLALTSSGKILVGDTAWGAVRFDPSGTVIWSKRAPFNAAFALAPSGSDGSLSLGSSPPHDSLYDLLPHQDRAGLTTATVRIELPAALLATGPLRTRGEAVVVVAGGYESKEVVARYAFPPGK
jgi:hypothetical protein